MLSTVHPYSVFGFVDIAKKRFFAQKPKTSDHNTSLLRIVRSNYVEIDQLYFVMFIDIVDSESLNLQKITLQKLKVIIFFIKNELNYNLSMFLFAASYRNTLC